MTGAIRGKEVMRHPVLIARGFGVAALCRCVWAVVLRRKTTFLAVIQ
jgi:hypothetical protein